MRRFLRVSTLLALVAGQFASQSLAVVIGDKEWRQLTETTGLSANEVYGVCSSGFCSNGTGPTAVLNGWYWASSSEVLDLLEGLVQPGVTNLQPVPDLPGSYIYEAFNDPDIDAAIGPQLFNPTVVEATYERFQGWTSTCPVVGTRTACFVGGLINAFDPAAYDSAAVIGSSTAVFSFRGVWLYRPVATVVQSSTIVLPDLNSDGIAEIAVLRDRPIRTEIRSGGDAALVGTVPYLDASVVPLGAKLLADSNGDGVAEIAVLARRMSDGRGVVEIRNVTGAPAGRQVWFAANHQPVSLAVIETDADGNGVAELAVLSRRNSDGRGLVEIKNAYGATNPVSIWVGAGLAPRDLEVVNDSDQNGVPEVAVLSSRISDGRAVVEVKNAAGATNPNAVWFMAGNSAIDLTVVDDADGNSVPEVAVLSSRNSDDRIVVEVKNASGPTNPTAVWFMAGQIGLTVEALRDADGNGVPELAVLSRRNTDGRVLVEVKNAAAATNARALWYPVGYSARDLAILPDLDGNGVHEAGALMRRDSDGRPVVQGRNAAGSQLPRDYWFTP